MKYIKILLIIFIAITIVLLGLLFMLPAMNNNRDNTKNSIIDLKEENVETYKADDVPDVGGECNYNKYAGVAEIISIKPISDSDSVADRYKIVVKFYPQNDIGEDKKWLNNKGYREEFMLLDDNTEPSEDFMKRNDIKLGKEIGAYIEVIKEGMCTPVNIYFPTLDLTNYPDH